MMEKINAFEFNELISFKIDSESAGERIDKILSVILSDFSRSFVQNLFADGLVFGNSKTVSKSFRPKSGDIISFSVPEPNP